MQVKPDLSVRLPAPCVCTCVAGLEGHQQPAIAWHEAKGMANSGQDLCPPSSSSCKDVITKCFLGKSGGSDLSQTSTAALCDFSLSEAILSSLEN